jgi:hypothetical protein
VLYGPSRDQALWVRKEQSPGSGPGAWVSPSGWNVVSGGWRPGLWLSAHLFFPALASQNCQEILGPPGTCASVSLKDPGPGVWASQMTHLRFRHPY